MTPPIEIRPADPDEFQLIGDLARVIWPATFGGLLSPGQIAYMMAQRYTPEAIRDAIALGNGYDLIRLDAQPVGYGAHGPTSHPREWKLWQVYILPSHQGNGIGTHYIEHVAARARSEGRSVLMLTVNRSNTPALRLYLRRGFVLRGSVAMDIGHGYVMDDHVLERPL